MGAKNATCATRGARGDTRRGGRQRATESARTAECGAVDGVSVAVNRPMSVRKTAV